jgi:branched-chain amino acid aminotransferase
MGALFYVNGAYVSEDDANLSIADLGVLRGFAVFDYLRTYGGKPFHLGDHLLRLQFSAKQIGLALPCVLSEIEKIVHELLEKNNFPESAVKIIVTGGLSSDQLRPDNNSSLIVMVYPLKPFADHFFQSGIKVITTPFSRSFATAKTTQYISAIVALEKAKSKGADEALYVNKQGEVLEGTTCNLFIVKEGQLITPPATDELLLGITRSVVLRLCDGCEERAIHEDELMRCDEAFLTSSTREVMPISHINGEKKGLGPYTRKIMEQFRLYTLKSEWDHLAISRHLPDNQGVNISYR